ncbi:protein of unknown function [Candidatus Nitrotoga arctica]|uniref:Uncharacterized protein n=1 Tax=Candidatus Nitrotoga arctica TaxID=453162 RepID=A0ABN8AMA8_9PROT|nr:protein of unknown function [Candidatus Nitrotoga arctica]
MLHAMDQVHRAYPRERGGNAAKFFVGSIEGGLSPRARGKPIEKLPDGGYQGPIPASAGETYLIC